MTTPNAARNINKKVPANKASVINDIDSADDSAESWFRTIKRAGKWTIAFSATATAIIGLSAVTLYQVGELIKETQKLSSSITEIKVSVGKIETSIVYIEKINALTETKLIDKLDALDRKLDNTIGKK